MGCMPLCIPNFKPLSLFISQIQDLKFGLPARNTTDSNDQNDFPHFHSFISHKVFQIY